MLYNYEVRKPWLSCVGNLCPAAKSPWVICRRNSAHKPRVGEGKKSASVLGGSEEKDRYKL